MRPSEAQKLKCGSRHFIEGLGVDYVQACGERERASGRIRGEVGGKIQPVPLVSSSALSILFVHAVEKAPWAKENRP